MSCNQNYSATLAGVRGPTTMRQLFWPTKMEGEELTLPEDDAAMGYAVYVAMAHAAILLLVTCMVGFWNLRRVRNAADQRAANLRLAVMQNEMAKLKSLIASGTPIDGADAVSGDTALHTATKWNFSEMVTELLNKGADANAANHYGITPLHYAASAGHHESARALLKGGAYKGAEAADGRLPFEFAGDDAMRVLCGGPPMDVFRALAKRDLAAVRACVSDGCDVSIRNADGDSLLALTVQAAIDERPANSAEGFALLTAVLSAEATRVTRAWSIPMRSGLLPLHLAALARDTECVSALLAAGMPVDGVTRDDAGGKTALHLVLDGDDDAGLFDDDEDGGECEEGLVRLLLDHNAEVDAVDTAERTPLHQAVGRGLHATARLLLAAHADPTRVVKKQTALHVAVFRSDARMVQAVLAASGAPSEKRLAALDLDAPGRDGWTPLGFAARSGSVAICRALLEAGALPGVAMPSGRTALDVALANKKPAVAKLLASASPAPIEMDR